jgi:hypothetical protein
MKACRFTAHSAHACLSTAPTERLKLSAESWQDKALRKRNLSGPDSRVEKSTGPGGCTQPRKRKPKKPLSS